MTTPTLREASEAALDWFNWFCGDRKREKAPENNAFQVHDKLRSAIALPEQEQPYAYERNGSFIPAWHCTEQPKGWVALFTAPRPPQPAQPVAYLCDGTRFKLSFDTKGRTPTLAVFGTELQGQWVALVDATDNRHISLVAPIAAPQPAVISDAGQPLPIEKVIDWASQAGFTWRNPARDRCLAEFADLVRVFGSEPLRDLTDAELDTAIDRSGWPQNMISDFIRDKLREVARVAIAAAKGK